MVAMKKESSGTAKKPRRPRKPKLNKEQLQLALRYEKAWHKMFYQQARWFQETVIEEPFGRQASDLASQVVAYVETNEDLKD